MLVTCVFFLFVFVLRLGTINLSKEAQLVSLFSEIENLVKGLLCYSFKFLKALNSVDLCLWASMVLGLGI